jgi:hypothetical protein
VVDDRFLTIGSANLTNRSMGLDSELHASWEVSPDARQERALVRAIRRLRVSLLAEHGGFAGPTVRRLVAIDGLVRRLNELTTHPGARLQQHGPPTPAQAAALQIVDPQALPFDPDNSDADNNLASREEPTDERNSRGPVARVGPAIGSLWRRLVESSGAIGSR